MGNYFPAFKTALKSLDAEIINIPITKRTIELGSKYSPEAACIPFKYNLGNFIEGLDAGANIIIQAGGGCRFGYYGEVQKEILKNLGYNFKFIKFVNSYNIFKLAKELQKINPEVSRIKILHNLFLGYTIVKAIDKLEDYVRKNIGFEKETGILEKSFKKFLLDIEKASNLVQIKKLEKRYFDDLKKVELDKPKDLIKVVIVGELYVCMESFSNFDIEKSLAKKGVEVHRHCTVSSILKDVFFKESVRKKFQRLAKPYLKNHIGAHGTESVGSVNRAIKEGFDGAIHIKPFACMPEVNAMTMLQKISNDYKFPIIYFSFDSQTSKTGVETRLEAFYDLLVMKKKKYV